MTKREIDLLAQRIVFYAKNDDEVMAKVAKMFRETSSNKKNLVSLKEAASILGISKWHLYHIKDDECGRPRFSYVKTGNSKSSPVKFNESTLMDEYKEYIALQKKTIRFVSQKAVAGL